MIKTFIFLLVTGTLVLNTPPKVIYLLLTDQVDRYCARMKDGKMIVMHSGMMLSNDVTLANGTQVKMDGTVITVEGARIVLKDGDCVDKEGKISTDI